MTEVKEKKTKGQVIQRKGQVQKRREIVLRTNGVETLDVIVVGLCFLLFFFLKNKRSNFEERNQNNLKV